MGLPHTPQNLSPTGTMALHFGQMRVPAATPLVPAAGAVVAVAAGAAVVVVVVVVLAA
jgi:hypothetical protein